MTTQIPPYDTLYALSTNQLLWGARPGRLVERVLEFTSSGSVLDLGCGDGKNAIFLEQLGFHVTGIDCSHRAIQGLHRRFNRAGMAPRGSYSVLDVSSLKPSSSYDVLLSYGLYHCLNPGSRLSQHRYLHQFVVSGGVILFTCLTNSIQLPLHHLTALPELPSIGELTQVFEGMDVLEFSEGEIVEEHAPAVPTHKHSAAWIVARVG